MREASRENVCVSSAFASRPPNSSQGRLIDPTHCDQNFKTGRSAWRSLGLFPIFFHCLRRRLVFQVYVRKKAIDQRSAVGRSVAISVFPTGTSTPHAPSRRRDHRRYPTSTEGNLANPSITLLHPSIFKEVCSHVLIIDMFRV